MRYLLLSVLVVCMIGLILPNVSAEKIGSQWVDKILVSDQFTHDEILDALEYMVNLDYYDYELSQSNRPDCTNNDCIPDWIKNMGGFLGQELTEKKIDFLVLEGLIGVSVPNNTIELPLDFSWKEDSIMDYQYAGSLELKFTNTDDETHVFNFGTPTCEGCIYADKDRRSSYGSVKSIPPGDSFTAGLNPGKFLNRQIDYFCALHPWERDSFQINKSDLTFVEPEIEFTINVYSANPRYYESVWSNVTPCISLDYPSECLRYEINRGYAPYDAKLTFTVIDPNGDVNSTWECQGLSCAYSYNELAYSGQGSSSVTLGQQIRVSEKKINNAFDSENWILKVCAPEHNKCVEKQFEVAIEVDIIRDIFHREFHLGNQDGTIGKLYLGEEYTNNALIEEFGSERLEKFNMCITGDRYSSGFNTKNCNITEDRDFAIQFIHDRADWYLEEIHTALEIAENGIISKDIPTGEKADIIQSLRNHASQMEDAVSNNKTNEISRIDRAISEFLHSEQEKLEREQLEDEIEREREQLGDEIESRSETTSGPLITEPETEAKSEPTQTNEGCGEGTVMVNGVCQLAPTQSITSFMSIEPIYLIIGVVAIGGIIGAIAVAKRGSKTPRPARQELDEYEEQYLAKEKPVKQKPKPAKQKPVEKKETSAFCENCGNTLNPKAKFCGKCGNQV